jgi:hypothetical protein
MPAHLRIIAAFFLVAGLISAATALLAPSIFTAAATAVVESGEDGAELGATVLTLTGRGLAIAGAVFALPCLACGWGLVRRRPWSRWLGIFLAALMVTQVPIGTALGGYVLWVLLSRRFEPWFEPGPIESSIPPA